jgi:hypothetical protein
MDLTSNLLGKAIQAVPAVKYALGIAGIVAALAVIGSLGVSYTVAFVGTVVMLVFMTALVVFARVSKTSNSALRFPALVFTWFSILLTMATACLLFSSVFFGEPVDLKTKFATAVSEDPSPVRVEADAAAQPKTATAPNALGIRTKNLPPPPTLSDDVMISLSSQDPSSLRYSIMTVTSLVQRINERYGVEVLSTITGGPGYRAGIRQGDIIDSLNGSPFWNNKQLLILIRSSREGERAQLGIWRRGQPLELTVTFGNALEIYTKACSGGDANACAELGEMYERGDGTDPDHQKGHYYLTSACERGDGTACGLLGRQNDDMSLVDKACRLGDAMSCTTLGLRLKSSDLKRAITLLSRACSSGDPYGCLEYVDVSVADLPSADKHSLISRACWWGYDYGCSLLSPDRYSRDRYEYEQPRETEHGPEPREESIPGP